MASTKKTLERLELIFTANQEQFDKQLKSIEDSIAGVKESVDGVSAGMGKTMTGAMTKAQIVAQILIKTFQKVAQVIGRVISTVFNLGKGLLTSGSQLTRMMVATNTLARNLGITQEELDGLRDSLAESNTYGIKAEQVISSLARTGLVEMAKSLEAVDARTGNTVKGVNALVLTMKDLGAVAGKSSSQAIADITDFISRGRTEAVEGMIAIGNLGTEYREFAKTLGKGRGELTAQEEAQARLNIVQREGAKAFGAYAEAYTTSGKMLDSITDATKSAFEELGAMLEPIWASATTAILGFVQNVRNFINQNEQVIKNWATKVAGWVVYVAETIAQFLSKIPVIGSVFQSLTNIQVKVAKSSEGMGDAIEGEADTMDDASGSASKLNKELRGLAGFDEMNVLKQPEEAGGGGGGASTTALTTPGIFENFGAEVDKVIDGIKKSIAEKFDPIKKKFEEFFKPIIDAWNLIMKPVIEELKFQWGELLQTIGKSEVLKTLGQVLGVIATIIGAVLVGAIAGVIKTIKNVINVLDGVAKFIGWVIGNIVGLFIDFDGTVKMMWEDIKNFFTKLWEDILGYFKRLWDQQPEVVRNALTGVWNWVVEIFTKIKDWITGTWETVATWFDEKVITPIRNSFTNLWNNLKNSATDAWEGIKRPFSNVANWFGDIFSKAWKKVKDIFSAGGSVFKGITDGIFSAFKNVVNSLIKGINTVVSIPFNAINGALRTIRNTKIAGLQPFGWLPTIYAPKIPYLAQGGIIENPTVAILGEAGREAVIPLQNNTGFIKELAEAIRENGGGGEGINLTVKLGERDLYRGFIDYLNERGLAGNSKLLRI